MKNVLKNILFSFCFTEQREIRAISPFIYSCARKKLWAETGLVKMNGKGNQGAFLGKNEKEGEGGCGTDRGGMKGKGTMCGKTQGKKKEMKLPDYIQEDT